MRELMAAAAERLRAQAEVKREELRFAELGTYARGLEEGRADVMQQFGLETFIEVGDDGDDDRDS